VAVLVFTLFFYCLRLLLNALWAGGPGHSNANAGGGGRPSSAQWEALLRELQALRAEVQGAYHTVIFGLGSIPLRVVWLTLLCCGRTLTYHHRAARRHAGAE